MTKQKQQTGKLSYIQIAPRKMRLLSNAIKGLPVWRAQAQLKSLPQRSSSPLLKLLNSTVANAKNNAGMEEEKLFVKTITVDAAPTIKRFRPRAFGRATPILKRTSQITITLEESQLATKPRYKVQPAVKKVKKTDKKSSNPKAEKEAKVSEAKTEKPSFKAEKKSNKGKDLKGGGVLKKMFRRKSI